MNAPFRPITPAIDTADTRAEKPVPSMWDIIEKQRRLRLYETLIDQLDDQVAVYREQAADMRHTAGRTLTQPTVISCERIGL